MNRAVPSCSNPGVDAWLKVWVKRKLIALACCLPLLLTSAAKGFSFDDLETSNWTACAAEGGMCRFEGTRLIRYGKEPVWSYAVASDRIDCSNSQFSDLLRGKAKVCEFGKTSSRAIEGPRITVRPVFYVFSDAAQSGLPTEADLRLISHYLAHARDHFKNLLGPEVSAFEIGEASVHYGRYESSALGGLGGLGSSSAAASAEGSAGVGGRDTNTAPDFEHAMLKEMFESRASNRYREHSVFVFILVNPNMQIYRPHWGGGGRSFNGGVNGGGGLVVLEYRRLRHSFYSTLIHELGHAFGLRHVDCFGQSMTESDSLMSYNPRHRSRGAEIALNPGTLSEGERLTLLLNPRIFPHQHDLASLQERSNACVLPAMDSYLGGVPTVHGLGYDLLFNNRMVSGFDAMFYTKAQAKRHCAAMRQRHPSLRVDCRFAGKPLESPLP
ncbi:MAG: hypothetical protein EBX67_06370 [Betaproteobacteria bacterium]|nr:hypothetical protein [Betaproteobacteria bacterium]